jgi:hypothetical protein
MRWIRTVSIGNLSKSHVSSFKTNCGFNNNMVSTCTYLWYIYSRYRYCLKTQLYNVHKCMLTMFYTISPWDPHLPWWCGQNQLRCPAVFPVETTRIFLICTVITFVLKKYKETSRPGSKRSFFRIQIHFCQ